MATISIDIELSSFFKLSVVISFLKSKPLSVTLCYRLYWLHFRFNQAILVVEILVKVIVVGSKWPISQVVYNLKDLKETSLK